MIIIIIIIIAIIITRIIMGVMSRSVGGGTLAFTEHTHSKCPDLCTLINPYGYQ